MSQLIDRPTRVTETSSTVIDHIWTNNPYLYSHRGVIEPGLSDHALIFACRKRPKLNKEKHTIQIRSRRKYNPIEFAKDVSNIDWFFLNQKT